MQSKKNILILLVLIVFLVALGYLTYRIYSKNDVRDSDASKTLGAGDSQQYQNLSGEVVSLRDFEGKVRVVNSWASWSPFSRQELIDLDRLAAEYKNRDVAVIAINRNEETARANFYIESQFSNLSNIHFLIDGDDTFYDRMDGQAMPESLFFDNKGNIIFHARGELSYEEMVTQVEAALSVQ